MSSPLYSLPRVPAYALDREFLLDQVNEEVTSIDMAPHGGFCVIACSNGAVLLYDMTNLTSQRNGYLLAHIRAKGMHTSLRLTVKISEDSRFCFVGVRKGSSDMIAIDMEKFNPCWEKFPPLSAFGRAKKQAMVSNSELVLPMFDVYAHNDPKLRGFGAATGVPIPASSTAFAEGSLRFWLACGMGIKNVHVWQLVITPPSSTSPAPDAPLERRDTWSCIFDVATNGSSISHLGFRSQGMELLTKCDNMNIRVWDLSQYDVDPTLKPAYDDIPNSTDVKCLMEQTLFTFGGAYEFAMVKVDKNTPKEANRNCFELPDKLSNALASAIADDEASTANQRRRRATREISDVIGTQDGMHALILCSDGLTMHYYRQNQGCSPLSVRKPTTSLPSSSTSLSSSSSSSPSGDKENVVQAEDANESKPEVEEEEGDGYDIGQVQELSSLVIDMDNRDQCWSLRRTGAEGHVVLLRVQRSAGSGGKTPGTPRKATLGTISITRLSSLVSKETAVAFLNTAGNWQTLYAPALPMEPSALTAAFLETETTASPTAPTSTPSSKGIAAGTVSSAGQGTPMPLAKTDPSHVTPKLPPKSGERKRKSADSVTTPMKNDVFSTPSTSKSSGASPSMQVRKTPRISPYDKDRLPSTPTACSPGGHSVASSIGSFHGIASEDTGASRGMMGIAMSGKYSGHEEEGEEEAVVAKPMRPLVIDPPAPVANRCKFSLAVLPAVTEDWSEEGLSIRRRMTAMLEGWKLRVAVLAERGEVRLQSQALQSLGRHTQAITVAGLVQLQRLFGIAVQDVERRVQMNLAYDRLHPVEKAQRRSPTEGLLVALHRHRCTLVETVLPRLRGDIRSAAARDMIFSQLIESVERATELPRRCLRDASQDFEEMVDTARGLVEEMDREVLVREAFVCGAILV